MEFSRELRDDVLAGDITLSVRLWKRPQVKPGGRYGKRRYDREYCVGDGATVLERWES